MFHGSALITSNGEQMRLEFISLSKKTIRVPAGPVMLGTSMQIRCSLSFARYYRSESSFFAALLLTRRLVPCLMVLLNMIDTERSYREQSMPPSRPVPGTYFCRSIKWGR